MTGRSAPIGIIDAGLGNIASIQRMIEKAGGAAVLVKKPDQLSEVIKVILPGVGHFDEGMRKLQATGFTDSLVDLVGQRRVSVLGICLGMQLLCRYSEEGSLHGLNLIDAEVKRFQLLPELNLKIPHMGWNVVRSARSNILLPESTEEQRFYFVHSYKVVPKDSTISIGVADYGGEFCATFQQENIFGVQFHPEKSHRFGLALMKRFIEL
jgi:glutamine amidotransferase